MSMHGYAVLMAASMTVAGCVTMRDGRQIDATKIPAIRVGATTRAEVIALFGEPQATERNANGIEHLTYRHSVTNARPDARAMIPIVGLAFVGGKVDHKTETLTIDLRDGVVVDFSQGTETGGGVAKSSR